MRWSIEELFYSIGAVSGKGMPFRWRLSNIFKSMWRVTKCIFKWIFTGYGWATLWNLDEYLVKVIHFRLKLFRKMNRTGYPADLADEEAWNAILDRLIKGFEVMLEPRSLDEQCNLILIFKEKDQSETVSKEAYDQETLELFVKYFRTLWD